MFSIHVIGSCTTFKMASQTPFKGSIQAANGSKKTYNHAMKNAIGQPIKKKMRNQRIAQRSPGQRPPFPLPSPRPSPAPILGQFDSTLEKKEKIDVIKHAERYDRMINNSYGHIY